LLEVTGLTYIDCKGLHALMDAHTELHRRGCELIVIGPSRVMKSMMRLSGLDRLVPLSASVDEAAALLRNESFAEAASHI
jgi:anti-anti-sigma factor